MEDTPNSRLRRRRLRWWSLAIALVGGIALVALLVSRDTDDEVSSSAPRSSSTSSTVASSTSSSSSSTSSSSTTSTTAGASTSTTRQSNVPGAIEDVRAAPGGGSGEIVLEWSAAPGATGYRVLRSGTSNGAFSAVGEIDITDGSATAADNVVNIWSERHSYIPSGGPLDAPDPSPMFQYVEVGSSGQQWFSVVAYNDSGEGPPSAVVNSGPR